MYIKKPSRPTPSTSSHLKSKEIDKNIPLYLLVVWVLRGSTTNWRNKIMLVRIRTTAQTNHRLIVHPRRNRSSYTRPIYQASSLGMGAHHFRLGITYERQPKICYGALQTKIVSTARTKHQSRDLDEHFLMLILSIIKAFKLGFV